MTALFVGMDVGGTKATVQATTPDGTVVVDSVFTSSLWSPTPATSAAAWLAHILAEAIPLGVDVIAVGIGAQGCDTTELCVEIEGSLAELGIPAVVVTDAALLGPAAGLENAIGLIADTGAIGVGVSGSGETLIAGGWGSVLSDDASAAGLIRIAVVAALTAHEEGWQDDGLLSALEWVFAVDCPKALARAVNDEPTPENWAPRVPAVFAAADAGSALAVAVIEDAAEYLVRVTDWLVRRGALGSGVVLAGSVIANQPRLQVAFHRQLAVAHPELSAQLLDVAPVVGGVILARRWADR